LVYGPKRKELEEIKKARRAKGQPVAPETTPPKIPLWCHGFLKAYSFLSSRRQHSMGAPQPILLTEMLAYARTFGFETETRLLILCVSEQDDEYFQFQNLKSEQQQRKKKAKTQPP
jgi:hypothetical protein